MIVIFNYRKIAKRMLQAGIETELARRYVELTNRERVLWRAAEREMRPHPLRDIVLHLPVCVAGESAEIVMLADQMIRAGIPLSLHLDGRGRPIGTPLRVLTERVEKQTGVVHTGVQVLSLYRDYLAAAPLADHSQRRIRRLPHGLRRLAMMRAELERKIDAYIQDNSERRFVSLIVGKSLRDALNTRPRASVVVSLRNGAMRVNGEPVELRGAAGDGAVIVQRPKLLAAAKRAKATVLLDCKKDHWAVWIDGNGPLVFPYEGM